MKRPLMLLIMLIMIVMLAGQVYSESEITTSGEVRIRCEFNNNTDKSFNKDDATVHQTLMRTRFNISAKINDNTSAFLQLQDSRRLGEYKSGNIGDNGDVYLHQGYFAVKELWKNGLGIKAGRFEVNLGNQRVFGAVGWHNVGRVWDGAQLICNFENSDFNGYWLRPRDDFDATGNTDFDIFGLTANLKAMHLELFGFLETDANRIDSTIVVDTTTQDFDDLNRINLGLYYWRDYKQFDFSLNLAYQMGNQHVWADDGLGGVNSVEEDIAAYMVTFEAGYTFEGDMKPRLAAGIDLSSGDDDLTDNKCKTYKNSYYTGHKFRGYMDYFLASEDAGLMDIMVRGKINPIEGWTIKGDFHIFSSAVERNVAGDKELGNEFDLTVSTSKISGMKCAAGFSMFMPDDKWQISDAESPIWLWMQGTVSF